MDMLFRVMQSEESSERGGEYIHSVAKAELEKIINGSE
jgi:hypothetical protein